MDRARWLLLAALITVAVGAMVAVTTRSDPAPAEAPDSESAAETAAHVESAVGDTPALERSSHLPDCAINTSTEGEDDHGLDVDRIAERVEAIRHLRFRSRPDVRLVSLDEIDDRIAKLVSEQDAPEADRLEGRALQLLGAIPEGSDVGELRGEQLEGQVAGYYRPETKELFVASQDDAGVEERATVAHELEHALADQRLGIPLDEEVHLRAQDAVLASQALVEGDASLVMYIYVLRHAGFADLLGVSDESFGSQVQAFDRLPYHLQRELLWPYDAGAVFACALYEKGGWRAVDRAYRDPPRSSAQVIFPETYGDPVVTPRPSGELPAPWKRSVSAQLGAAELMWLFEAPGGDPERSLPDPTESVRTWTGGEATLWERGRRSAMGISLTEKGPAPLLCAAMAGWYSAAFPDDPRVERRPGEELAIAGSGRAAVLRCPPGRVKMGIAPTLDAARVLAG